MALDDELDPRILQEFRRQLEETGDVTEDLRKQIKETGSTFEKYFNKALRNAGNELHAMAGNAKDLAFGLVNGSRGFEQLNPLLDAAANALGAMTSFLPVVGGLIDGASKVAVEGSKLMLAQMQQQLDTFVELGNVGALTTEGMTGLQRQFLESGLSLESYTRAVQNSAMTLARFRGMTATGAEDFSEIVGAITRGPLGDDLRRIGLGADEIGEVSEGFLNMSTRLGMSQIMTNKQLSEATVVYAKELDQLSKATGMSRKAIMDQQDAALSEARFRSVLEGIQDKGVRQNLLNFQTSVSAVNGNIGQGLRDLASGFVNTNEAIALYAQTGGEATKILDDLKAGNIDEYQARLRLQEALRGNEGLLLDLGPAIGDASIMTQNLAGQMDILRADVTKTGYELDKAQKGQTEGADALTEQTISAKKKLEGMNIAMTTLFFAAMPKAAETVDYFTDILLNGIIKMTETFDADLANTMRERARVAGVDVGGSYSVGGMDRRLDLERMLNAGATPDSKYYQEQVSNTELIDALRGMGVDTLKEGYWLDFARKYGLSAVQQFQGANWDQSMGDVVGDFTAMTKFKSMPGTTLNEFMKDIRGYAEGGIAAGPKTGYKAMLHGTEAIVPLDDGASIPVNIEGQNRKMEEQVSILKDHSHKLDEMIRLMTQGNSLGRRNLSASYS